MAESNSTLLCTELEGCWSKQIMVESICIYFDEVLHPLQLSSGPGGVML